jgi:hypothetical protein
MHKKLNMIYTFFQSTTLFFFPEAFYVPKSKSLKLFCPESCKKTASGDQARPIASSFSVVHTKKEISVRTKNQSALFFPGNAQ